HKYSGYWRNKATNYLIDQARGGWILSLEPDFFIKDYGRFFGKTKSSMWGVCDGVSFEEANRFHPAFFLFKKETLDRTG
ncbi:hypothetical protein ABK046_51535, partial [Streptomyces caeruleatus]